MADITINAVSASYTGTENADDFKNGTGNLRDITVAGLSGDDLLSFGSAVQAGTGDGGVGLGFSIASSEIAMGAGEDTFVFSGQAGSGSTQLKQTNVKLGAGDDYSLINGLVSASASTVRANEGDDELVFTNAAGAGSTATDVIINANAGADSVNFAWTGTEVNAVGVLGGAGNDTISATFNYVSANATAKTTFSGAKVGGGKNDDSIAVNVIGTSDQVRINGNSGADTITVTAAADNLNFGVAGGKGNDLITAAFVGANSSDAVTVAGSLGDDTVNVKFSGGHVSGLLLNGASGEDALVFSNQGAIQTAASVELLGGTGADTITLNLGGALVITGASGFVADLGAPGANAITGGTEGVGGSIDVNLSAVMSARTGAGAFFRGTNTGDTIDVSNRTGEAGGLSNVIFSGEEGKDTITFSVQSAGAYSATTFLGGDDNDLFTAQIGVGANFAVATGGRVSFEGGAGKDTIVINIEAGADLSAALFDGGDKNDEITLNLLSGGSASVVNSGTELVGGLGDDTISIVAAQPTTAGAIIRAGSGDDVITGTFASGAVTDAAFSAFAGSGADTIAFTFTAAATGGTTLGGAGGAVLDGGDGADSITVVGFSVTGGTLDVGDIRGGAGNDTITFGGMVGDADNLTSTITGTINGGAGSDSIIFSGNNARSAGGAIFAGGGTNGSAGFVFASGDSVIGGFDTIAMSNDLVTGGQTNLNGNMGSAGFLFTGFNDAAAGNFNVAVQGVGNTTGGGFDLGQAIFTATNAFSGGAQFTTVLSGGVIGAISESGGGVRGAGIGTFQISGTSTLTQIFSAVDAQTVGRGTVSVFNVMNGSAGSVDGYMFIQGGFTDSVVKFDGHGLAAGALGAGDYFFSAGDANALAAYRSQGGLNSGGQVFFGANVGVG